MSCWTGRGNGVRNVAHWLRLITVLGILLQMLLVPASQAQPRLGQDQQGRVELAASGFTFTVDCTQGTVSLDTDSLEVGWVGVWINTVLVWNEWQIGDWSRIFTWSDYVPDVCTSRTLRAVWFPFYIKYDQNTSFGGSAACPENCQCQQTTEWQTVQTGPWYYDAGQQKVCRDLLQHKFDVNDPTHVCDERTIQDCSYTDCTEKVKGEAIAWGPWTAEGEQVCRIVTYQWYDKFHAGVKCGTTDEKECDYVDCTEKEKGEAIAWGPWTAEGEQVCRIVTYQWYDKYHTGVKCGTTDEKECDYVDCTEKEKGEAIAWGPWTPEGDHLCRMVTYQWYDKFHADVKCGTKDEKECDYVDCTEKVKGEAIAWGPWTAEGEQVCRIVTYQWYDKYHTGVKCGTTDEKECDYVDCTEKVKGEAIAWGPWTEEGEQLCREVTYQWYDKFHTDVKCGTTVEKECNYLTCTDTVLGSEVSRRGPEYKDGQLCWWVTYAVLDEYTGAPCGTTELERCENYQTCSVTRRGRELSREGPFYPGSQICYQVTYELLDAFTGALCGQETVQECQALGNGCNHPNLNPSVVRQGQSVNVSFSAWGPGITRIEVYLLGDSRDGPHPGGGGAWYLVAASGPEGGSTAIGTSSLYPKERTVWVKALYPGGWSNCYGRFTVTPGPTPTLPVPGFVPCPNCVQDIVYQSNKEGQWDIYTASANGRNELRLTGPEGNDAAPAWYPSGQYIAFQTDRDANWEIYTMDANGANQINLTNSAADEVAPFWSCSYVYYQSNRDGNWELYRICVDGSAELRLTDNAATDAQPAVSLDERVAFQSNRDGNWEIYSMNTDGTGVRRLTNTTWAEMSPQFSPNGQWIVYQTHKTGQWEVAVMDLNGQNVRYIVRTASPDESPAWHPYCDWIYFQSMRQGSWDIYRTNQDGTVTQRITTRASSAEMLDDAVDY